MLRIILFNDIKSLAFYIFIFTLPFSIQLNTYTIIIWGCVCVLSFFYGPKQSWNNKIAFYSPFFLLFSWLILGVIYSTGLLDFFKNTDLYYSLLFIPIFFSLTNEKYFDKTFKTFLISLVFTILLSLILAIVRNYHYNLEFNLEHTHINPWFFSYKYLSNPSYLEIGRAHV